MDYEKASEFLKALAHPVRLRMVRGLLDGRECNVGTMMANLGLPQSTVSQHLRILRNAGIVALRKDGVRACYHVSAVRVHALLAILEG
jgi:DNA-binding transcriptional ArsR family regulator